jgi:hypothetical protein
MRNAWTMAVGFVVVVMAAQFASAGGLELPRKGTQQPAPAKLILHEWGTFTNFAGSDGVYLEFRPLQGSDLPSFVFDRQRQASLVQKRGWGDKAGLFTYSRMETPVTYFYTDEPMAVNVRVDFPKGLLTEFYPPAMQMAPMPKADEKTPPVGNSYIDWGQFAVFPQGYLSAERLRIPEVKDGNHYAAARETDSDVVWFSDRASGNFQEKFLFYRGAGNFQMPLTMESLEQDRFVIHNSGKEAISSAFLVNIDENGRVRFAQIAQIDGTAKAVSLPSEVGSLESLGEAMVRSLVAEGLYEKEARAMVKTWKSSWFGEEGTRLLYVVPRPQTDAILPLRVTPKPTETVRVMVGRLEALTSEREARVRGLIQKLGAADCAEREEATRQIKLMGRFAEPALERVAGSGDAEARERVEEVVGMLREEE